MRESGSPGVGAKGAQVTQADSEMEASGLRVHQECQSSLCDSQVPALKQRPQRGYGPGEVLTAVLA